MKAFQTTDFRTLIGIDWADSKHDICQLDQQNKNLSYQVIPATPKGIHEWANALQQQYPNGRIAVGCELTKGPLVYALEQYDQIVIFPINPTTVAKYRQAFTHSGAKDDPSDAYCQVEILQNHLAKLKPITPQPPHIRSLSRLVEGRRKLVGNRVSLSNHITALLKDYYPQVLQWFTDKDTLIFCDFVTKWPTLKAAQRARPTTLRNFFNAHNARNIESNERRIESIKTAISLTTDEGIIEPNQILVNMLINQLRVLITSIDQLDREIRQRYRKQKDRVIFDSFPGAGPQLAPRLLVAFGTQRDRYDTAADIQKYAGVAPVLERSGQKSWVHWRYSCPKFLRQTFIEWAGQSVRFSFWANAYYQQQIGKGKTHQMAIRSLAFKWIRIAFRCWKNSTPYDETKYLEALKSRGSPLLEYAVK